MALIPCLPLLALMNPDATSVIVILHISRVKCFEYFHCQSQIRNLKATTSERVCSTPVSVFSPLFQQIIVQMQKLYYFVLMESLIVDKIDKVNSKNKKKKIRGKANRKFYFLTLI